MNALDAVEKLASTTSVEERIEAATWLATHPDDVPDTALPVLLQSCGDESEEVVQWAESALEEIQPSLSSLAEISKLVSSSEEQVAYWSCTLLGRLGAAAEDAADPLAKVLGSNAPLAVRERAAWALGKIGSGAPAAVEALKAAAEDGESRLGRLAAKALER